MYSYEHRPNLPQNAQDCIGVQVMGPGDGYLAQSSTDLKRFWGDRNDLKLGACLKPANARRHGKIPMEMVPEVHLLYLATCMGNPCGSKRLHEVNPLPECLEEDE